MFSFYSRRNGWGDKPSNRPPSNDDRTFATPGFVDALRARVNLYQGNWAAAQSNALDVINSGDYALTEVVGTLFPDDEGLTSEDIFTPGFTEDAFNTFGFYYQYAGRFEVGGTEDIYAAYPEGDERWAWNFGETDVGEVEVTKFPTTVGAENFHVIRYVEVVLTLAEAMAQQVGAGNLASAVQYMNMVRSGRAVEVIPALTDVRSTLWPIPQGESNVAPNMIQNPGY